MTALAIIAVVAMSAAFLLIFAAFVVAVREDAYDARHNGRMAATFTDDDIDDLTDAITEAFVEDTR